MKKITALDNHIATNIFPKYFEFNINKNNFGIFSMEFGNEGVYIKPMMYKDSSLTTKTKHQIDYDNIYGEKITSFIFLVNNYCGELTKQEFDRRWNYAVKNLSNVGRMLRDGSPKKITKK